jgi:hypothetical protein
MTAYLIVNGTATALTDVNIGGTDVPAYSKASATLTDAEIGTLLGTAGVAVVKDAPSVSAQHLISKVLVQGSDFGAQRGDGTLDGTLKNDDGDDGLDD